MGVFEYIVSIHSIVLGLAIASLLSTFAEQLRQRDMARVDWLHSLWCISLLFQILSGWWGYWYTFEEMESMSIFTFAYSFQFSIAMYLCARLLSLETRDNSHAILTENQFLQVKTPFLIAYTYGISTWILAPLLGVYPDYGVESSALLLLFGSAFYFALILVALFSNNKLIQGIVVVTLLILQVAGEAAQGALG